MYPGGFQHGKYTRKILKIWVPSYLRGSYLSPATNLPLEDHTAVGDPGGFYIYVAYVQ